MSAALTQIERKRFMDIIANIDLEIFKCISSDITTSEVIMTDERIAHVKERHPDDYEVFFGYIRESLEEPDYIIEANKPKSGVVVKEIQDENGQYIKTLLRVHTSDDEDAEYKNSVITFHKLREKEWNRLINNKKILYKRE